MDANIINIKDFNVRTPGQVVRVFFELYNETSIRIALWEVFRLYAVNDEQGIKALDRDEAKVALLFDQLIELVGAIGSLRAGEVAGNCVVCGRREA